MTQLQQRIAELVKKGRSVRQVVSVTKASQTYVRRVMAGLKPVRAPRAQGTAGVAGATGTIGASGVRGTTGVPVPAVLKAMANGHLSLQAIEAKAREYIEKAVELRRAATALERAGLIS